MVACSPAQGERRASGTGAAIDSLVELTLSVAPAPGISIAVVHRGDTIAIRGYGIANLEHQVPVTDRTVFHIASVTKSFTAAAVIRQVDEGRLRLDSTVREVLPEYDGPVGGVTIQQLLNHTSGIPDYIRRWERYGDRLPLTYEEMREVFREPLHFEPGTGFSYTSSGYYLLGRILEAVAWPETYPEHLARTQFQPLGLEPMHRCNMETIIPHRAQGYHARTRQLVNASPFTPNELGSDGGLCGTARDLARWIRGLASEQIMSDSAYRQMITPARVGDRELRTAHGLRLRRLDGVHPYVWHTGAMLSFTAVLAHYPEEDLTIAALSNGPLNLFPLQEQIARLVLGIETFHGDG